MENAKVKLGLCYRGVSKLALSIPLAQCNTFAVYPLKWLRFLGYAIYGREGYLSISKDGGDLGVYTANVEARAYYFISQHEPRFVDVDAIDDRTSDASELTPRGENFRDRLIMRDGSCVLSLHPAISCQACHILPHAKGSNYISNVIDYRGDHGVNNLNDIDDPQNGLLLFMAIHRPFAAGHVAFLKTPNFALSAEDIPRNPGSKVNTMNMQSRLTLQHFGDTGQYGEFITAFAGHNFDARQAQNENEQPSTILLNFAYGCAALRAWGSNGLISYVRRTTRDAYYNEEAGEDMSDDAPEGGTRSAGTSKAAQDEAHSQCYAAGSARTVAHTGKPEDMPMSDIMDAVLALWMLPSKEGERKREEARAAHLARKEDSIKAWLQSTEQ